MVDSIYRTRSLGVAAQGIPDQYADGKAAKVWELYIGSKSDRTTQYKEWLVKQLEEKNCINVLDAACGTGVDSILLLESGFSVLSCDASDKMLKYALKERWNRRKEDLFDKWEIEEANWLTLKDDLEEVSCPEGGFDAVVCLGNSFAHLPDFDGDQRNHKLALGSFHDMLRPGGILLIDHRNYDSILDTGRAPAKNVYYNSLHIKDIKVSSLYVNNLATLVTLDYTMDCSTVKEYVKKFSESDAHFRLSYYPHRLKAFSLLLKDTFGATAEHSIYGDFKPIEKGDNPAYYIHMIQKPFENQSNT